MRKRKPAAKPAALSAARRREALEAVSGVERKKPASASAVPEKAQLAHERRKSLQDLGLEAFNHLFRAYGQKPVAC